MSRTSSNENRRGCEHHEPGRRKNSIVLNLTSLSWLNKWFSLTLVDSSDSTNNLTQSSINNQREFQVEPSRHQMLFCVVVYCDVFWIASTSWTENIATTIVSYRQVSWVWGRRLIAPMRCLVSRLKKSFAFFTFDSISHPAYLTHTPFASWQILNRRNFYISNSEGWEKTIDWLNQMLVL